MDGEKVLKEYPELQKKYNLPSLESLEEDFDVEKILEKESSFLLREIRRAVHEKLSAYLHLFETLINPASPPMFVFSLLKRSTEKDRGEIQNMYKKLSKFQIEVMKLDTVYSEEKEAEYIKEAFDEWQKMKTEIYAIIDKFESDFEEETDREKGAYLG